MLERIICPKCGNEFSLEIDEASTTVVCGRCREEFVHTSDVAPIEDGIDPMAETVEMRDKGQKKGGAEKEVARPGMTIGNYEILEEIGRGAVGVVYKARQKSLDRLVALKILLAGQAASEEQIQRFHQEALAVAKLRHPNIVPVYDVGVHEGKHYFAMEYVDGKPLNHMMKKSRFTPNEALDIILKVSEAISDAHRHGIIHRDIKPANIMMDEAGRVQVMDFGLAKEVEADGQFTRSGTTMGTPNYMPVEQAQGDNRNIDARSDIYSLGAVLYEMLTGVPPFVAETNLKTILKVINEEPLPPRRRNPYIHRDIETICTKAMEKDKSRRYETVDAFIKDIRRFQAGEPIQARPASAIYRISKKIRKYRAVIAGSVGTIVAIVVLALLWNLIFPPQPPGPVRPEGNGPIIPALVRPVEATKLPLYEGEIPAEARNVFLTTAAAGDQFLAIPIEADRLPDLIEADMDILVAPDAVGDFGVCLYAQTDRNERTGFYSGFVISFNFTGGALHRVTLMSGGVSYNPFFVPSPPLRTGDGRLHVRLWRDSQDVFVRLGEAAEPMKFSAAETSGLKPEHGEGVGLALYGRGIDWENLRVQEIVPPWDKLRESAYDMFRAGKYTEARIRYEKFLAAYRKTDSKIDEEEFFRAELYIAVCLANEAGLYNEVFDRARLTAAGEKLAGVVENYGQIEKFRPQIEPAEEDLLLIRLRLSDMDLVELTREAAQIASNYKGLVEAGDITERAFRKLPRSVVKALFDKEITPEKIGTYNQMAKYYVAAGELNDAAELLQSLSDYYAGRGEFEKARNELDKILALQFEDKTDNIYRKAARIRRAETYLKSDDRKQYNEANAELFHLCQTVVYKDDVAYFVFDPALGPQKVAWGRNYLEQWLASPSHQRDNDALYSAHRLLTECLRYIEPEKPPEPDKAALDAMQPPQRKAVLDRYALKQQMWLAEHLAWRIVMLNASLELVRVEYARGTSPIVMRNLLEPFRKNPNIANELRAQLAEVLARLYSHSNQFAQARQLCREIIDNYGELAEAGVRAVDLIVETHMIEGIRGKYDTADINVEQMKNDLTLLERFPDADRRNIETRIDAAMKAAFARALQYRDCGRDESGRETPEGEKIRKDYGEMMQAMEDAMNKSGLSSESYARQMHEMMNPGAALSSDSVAAYESNMARQQDSYKRNEMKFTLVVKLLFENTPAAGQRAAELIEEIKQEDPLDEYWFTRFLKEYEKRGKEPPSSAG